MKRHVYPNHDLSKEKYAIVEVDDAKFLIDLKEADVLLTVTPDITIYSHSLGSQPPVHTEEYVVDETQILGYPSTEKKLQAAMKNLREERVREKTEVENDGGQVMRTVFGTGKPLEDDLDDLF
jgi:hypothetical protein